VRVLGLDPARQPLQVKAKVGYLPDQIGFYDRLTGRENLIFTAKLIGLKRAEMEERIEACVQRTGMAHAADHRVSTYSRGMRQRLGVAELLLKQPQIIIMDEPTLGLDPEVAHAFLQTILELKGQGITVLLSSHLLYQVQEVCDRVGLFQRGRLLLEGTVSELAEQVLGGGYRVELQLQEVDDAVEKRLAGLPGVLQVHREGRDRLVLEASSDVRAEAAEAVIKAGQKLRGLSIEQPSLDEIYSRYFQEAEHAQIG
jgi:ABC-2 type transport system ATP-binding protein